MMHFLKLIRYKNLLMVALTMFLTKYALIDYSLTKSYLSNNDFILLSLGVLFITAGGYVINDIFDIEVDKINKPEQLLIGNFISKKNAWIIYVILTSIGLILGAYISIEKVLYSHIWYFIAVSISLFIYSKYLQKTILLGNLLIAILCGLVIYLIYSFDFRVNKESLLKTITFTQIHNIQNGHIALKFYIIFSVLTTFIREIIKDIEDMDGDYNGNYKTLPIVFGKRRAKKLSIGLTLFLLLVLFIFLVLVNSLKMNLLMILLIAIILITISFLLSLWKAKSKNDFKKVGDIMKTIMLIGISSMAIFKPI